MVCFVVLKIYACKVADSCIGFHTISPTRALQACPIGDSKSFIVFTVRCSWSQRCGDPVSILGICKGNIVFQGTVFIVRFITVIHDPALVSGISYNFSIIDRHAVSVFIRHDPAILKFHVGGLTLPLEHPAVRIRFSLFIYCGLFCKCLHRYHCHCHGSGQTYCHHF